MQNYNQSSLVVFDIDDFSADEESNAMNYLIELKALLPQFKVTLFTILGRWLDLDMLKQIARFDWIELCAHGYEHFENDEVLKWDKKHWYDVIIY